jgi:hypothetical protein
MKQLEWLRRPIQDESDHPFILLDSGMYSVWRSGAKVDVDKYYNYCTTVAQETLSCVNMDTIPGAWGRRPTPYEVEAACQASFDMWIRLCATGAHIMPVYHQTDSIQWLHKYIEAGATYIGISPTDSFAPVVRHQWLLDIHQYMRDCGVRLNEDVFTHGLGVFSPRAVMPTEIGQNIGFWSADASTLMRYIAIKRILIPKTDPAWDVDGRVIGWVPIYVGKRGNDHVTVTNIGWDFIRKYVELHKARHIERTGRDPEWIYTFGHDGRLLIDDYTTLASINLILAKKAMHQSGVRCFVAGQLPLAIWQIAVNERYPYILRSYAVIKETHGDTIRRIYNRTWEKPARRPERDHKVVTPGGLFPQLGHSGW